MSVEEDVANCSHLQYIHEDSSRHKLLLLYTLRSSSSSRHMDYPHITEPVLRESKAGLAVGKLRSHASKQVADQVKDLVKKWKQTVEQAKLQNGKGSASSGVSKPQARTQSLSVAPSTPTTPSASTPAMSHPKPSDSLEFQLNSRESCLHDSDIDID
ncbi:hypothetical protein BC835DRAFT_1418966 [Cytidiella melzeri]|nr:hypothetical protein BC835DRAFT_1418966 [Cytidiella melzeri]